MLVHLGIAIENKETKHAGDVWLPRVGPRHMQGHYEGHGNAIRPRTVGPSNPQ